MNEVCGLLTELRLGLRHLHRVKARVHHLVSEGEALILRNLLQERLRPQAFLVVFRVVGGTRHVIHEALPQWAVDHHKARSGTRLGFGVPLQLDLAIAYVVYALAPLLGLSALAQVRMLQEEMGQVLVDGVVLFRRLVLHLCHPLLHGLQVHAEASALRGQRRGLGGHEVWRRGRFSPHAGAGRTLALRTLSVWRLQVLLDMLRLLELLLLLLLLLLCERLKLFWL
mmetsp:Transcript_111760/g.315663  ORF Transcript_111760/g.315663 Transcript_111760/m.315663 type:complete len:226 (+) Transcript_111760:584-1261(+)